MLTQDSGEVLFSGHQPRGLKAGSGVGLAQDGVEGEAQELGSEFQGNGFD